MLVFKYKSFKIIMGERGFTVGDLLVTLIVITVSIVSIKTFRDKNENSNLLKPYSRQISLEIKTNN